MLLASWVSLPMTLISCKSSLHEYSLQVSCHVRFGLSHLLLPPSGVQSITRLAGRDVGRRSTCPMNLLRLSATMSCRSPTPALDRSSAFVMWPFRDTPIMSRRHLLLNTLSCLSCQLSSTFRWHRWQMGWQLMYIGASLCFYWYCLTSTLGEDVGAPMKLSLLVCVCHSRHHHLLICCCQGTGSAPQTLCHCAQRSGIELVCFNCHCLRLFCTDP